MLDFKGNFSDGSYAIGFGNQHSYSDSRSCTCLVTSNGTGTVVEVQFEKFSIWAGDSVHLYQTNNTQEYGRSLLLAKLHGIDLKLPPFRATGSIMVRFQN